MSPANNKPPAQKSPRGVFEDLGVPVKTPQYNGYVVGEDKDGKEVFYFCFSQWGASLFLLKVDPDAGATKQINVSGAKGKGCTFAKSLIRGPDGRIYVGTAPGGFILRYDPKKPDEGLKILGRPSPSETYIYSMVIGKDGKIYAGTYGGAHLVAYDPEREKMEDLGPVDETQMYAHSLAAGKDGLIYIGIGSQRANIVAFDPKSGRRWSVIPPEWRLHGRSGYVMEGRDGKVYGYIAPRARDQKGQSFILEKGVAKPIPPNAFPGSKIEKLRDGRYICKADPEKYVIKDPSGKETCRKFRYKAAGSMVYVVGLGPEGKIYGSSALPLRLFVFDPVSRELKNLGNPTSVNGEIYSLLGFKGKLYVCAYPGGWLSVYDPNKPFNYGTTKDSNPKGIGYLGEGHLRPRAMVLGPDDKIYIGSLPPYGEYGGAMAIFDPEKEKVIGNYRNIVLNQGISALAYEPESGLIFGGSSIFGGGGTRPIEKEAKIFAWDPKRKEKIFETVPVPGDVAIVSMESANGEIFATSVVSNTLFFFDPSAMKVTYKIRIPFGRPHQISLKRYEADGYIYGLAGNTIFRVNPETYKLEKVADYPGTISCGFAVSETGIYFGSDVHLIRYRWETP
ncbi:hypothetical protein CW702_00830 [Candidatus Bathyarchaeota archaeon]|nr:MAG: hypothetical protein CW702_00830 [Candidatus Bathyarchaeota archaeon]